MIFETYIKGPIEDNNYLLIDEASKEAVLIDCTEPADDIIDRIKEYGAVLKYIILTHAHFDHVLGVNYFKEKTGAKAFIHSCDADLLININDFLKKYSMPAVEVQTAETFDENDNFCFGENIIKVIHTPGHTKGSVCFLIGDKLFSGDTIFYESVGRTDFEGGSAKDLTKSIKEKIFNLDESIKIYPGHGCETSVGYEKRNNRHIR